MQLFNDYYPSDHSAFGLLDGSHSMSRKYSRKNGVCGTFNCLLLHSEVCLLFLYFDVFHNWF